MTQKANAPIFVLIVLIIVSLSLAGGGFYLFQRERVKVIGLEEKLEEVTSQKRITEARLEESKKVVGELQTKLQESRDQLDKATIELQQEKSYKEEALSKAERLSADMEQYKNASTELEKKVAQAQEEARKAQAQLKDLESQKNKLEAKIKEIESGKAKGVELGNIVVNPAAAAGAAAGSPATKESKVLVVNKDYNFAVINLGAKDGVAVGDVFSVYHGTDFVGEVKVEKVHEAMAAAGFTSEDLKNKVSEGDRVMQKAR